MEVMWIEVEMIVMMEVELKRWLGTELCPLF